MFFSMLDRYKDRMGDYNAPPPNFKEVTADEFAKIPHLSGVPDKLEYRQIILTDNRSPLIDGVLHWYNDGHGWMINQVYWNKEKSQFEYTLRFYTFSICEHDFGKDEGTAMFEHKFTCKKCGYTYGYDSSG
jgi:hypothetical protein